MAGKNVSFLYVWLNVIKRRKILCIASGTDQDYIRTCETLFRNVDLLENHQEISKKNKNVPELAVTPPHLIGSREPAIINDADEFLKFLKKLPKNPEFNDAEFIYYIGDPNPLALDSGKIMANILKLQQIFPKPIVWMFNSFVTGVSAAEENQIAQNIENCYFIKPYDLNERLKIFIKTFKQLTETMLTDKPKRLFPSDKHNKIELEKITSKNRPSK